jgi:hypothetical protein
LDQESYSSSDDSDLDMDAVMDYINNTRMQLADDSDSEGHTGLGALGGDSDDDSEDEDGNTTYIHLGLGAAPASKRRRQNQKVAEIVERMEQGYMPAVEMDYRKKAKDIVRNHREMEQNVYMPQGSPSIFSQRSPSGGNSKERRRERRDHEAKVQKYAARPFVRAQDPSSMLQSEKTVIVTESSTSSKTPEKAVPKAPQRVTPTEQVFEEATDKSRSWWPKMDVSVTIAHKDVSAVHVETVVKVDQSIAPTPEHSPAVKEAAESLPSTEAPAMQASEEDMDVEESKKPVFESMDSSFEGSSEEEEDLEDEAESESDSELDSEEQSESEDEDEELEKLEKMVASDDGSEAEEEDEEEDEFDYDKMMEDSSGDEDENAIEGSSSESESILIEFGSDSDGDSDEDAGDFRSRKERRRSLPGVPRWDEGNDDDDALSEEEEILFKKILRGSFESAPTLLANMPMATAKPRCTTLVPFYTS